MNLQESQSLVYVAMRQVNAMRAPNEQIPERSDVVLVGDDGVMDSLALMTLILALEEGFRERIGKDVSIMGENNFDKLVAHFRTPEDIAKYLLELL